MTQKVIDLSVDEIATGLHVALGALFITLPVCWGWPHAKYWGTIIGIIFAVIKEFWFDLRYETPETSGGISGGILDFCGYMFGILAAHVLLLL